MKLKYIVPILLIAIGVRTALGQEFDLSFSVPENNTQTHQARNSISLLAGYSYTPNGGTLIAEIVNPVVNGSMPYYSFVDPANRSLNTSSYLVGATSGAFDVNPAGGASYTIPIDVLPGVNGLAPSLALVYSSNSGSGVAGYGWQIGGISVIGRTGKTMYNDGATAGVDLTTADKFTLDGQRLVLAPSSGTYGGHMATYQTEIDGFTRVQSQYYSGNGPEKFYTQTKSGLKNFYGFDDDGRQRIDGYSEVLNWYITETSDLYGNLISYSYLKDNSMVYPAEIVYGPNKVTFYYKERTDVTTSYLKGKKIQQRLLLEKITVAYYSNVVKTYEMKYNYLSSMYYGQSVLNEVIEYGTGGSRLNSTIFSYQQPGNITLGAETYLHTQADISTNSILYSGDFNGDGLNDILTLDKSTKKTTKLYLGNTSFDRFTFSSQITYNKNLDNIVVTDLNGDGKDDLMLVDFDWIIAGYNYVISTGTTFSSTALLDNYSCDTRPYYNQNDLSADYDGDGKNDILVKAAKNGASTWAIYSYGTSSAFKVGSGSIASWGDQSFNGDFNGDGKSDIWVFDANGLKIYSLSGTTLVQIYTDTWPKKDHYFQLGDFNGDGRTDMFVYGYTTYDWSDWQIHLSTGTGFEGHSFAAKKSNLKGDKVFTADFNGDGRTDILALSKNTSNNPRQYYFVSNSNGDNLSSQYQENSYMNKDYDFALGDFSGDGKTDILVTPSTTGFRRMITTGTENNYLLKFISDGLGNTIEPLYSKLTNPYCYEKTGGSSTFPVFTYQGPMTVVNRVWYNGASTRSLEYVYKGLNIHRQGKGSLGFSQINVTDYVSGILTKTQSGYNTTYYYPQVNTVTKKATNGTTIETDDTTIETTVNDWAQTILDATNKRIFPYVSSSTQTNALTGHVITGTTSSVDSYGNSTGVVKSYNNGVSETTVANYTNTVSSTDWKLGRLDNSTITYAKSGEQSVSHTVSYTYSSDGILKPDLIYYNKDTPLEYFDNHDYNSQGNLTQLHTYGASIGISQSNYTYTTDGIRLLTKTDPLGHVTTNTYDSYGRLYTEKDYLNNTNTYQYDGMGRQTLVSSTIGSQTTTTYVWTGTNKPTSGLYGVTQTGNDGSVSTVWYDKLQRAIRAEKKGFGGQMILIDTEYNTKGQFYRVSDPQFAPVITPIWAETYSNYDACGRITVINRNTGRNTAYAYSANRVTETTAGKESWKETNSQGLVTTAHDNGGDIIYTYYPDGKVKNITAPGNVVTEMQYADAARNQTQLKDPSAGTITYTYNSRGQIKKQTDARSQLTTYNYHDDGRTETVITPEGTTTYSYNTNKQLTGISSPNSVSRSYGYDTKGRVNSVGETIVGTSFSTSFTYDTYGRLGTRTHPSTIVETMGYNSNGYLSNISTQGSPRYTINSMNAREQLTGAMYGMGLMATYGFDTYGYPISTATGSVQDYRYSFDPVTGNLNWRKNVNRSNITENFSYTDNGDNLDRLTSVTGPQNLSMTYNANGNIKTKSDISSTVDFGYGTNAGPYALTGVTSSTNVIPSTSQTATYTSFEKVNTLTEGVNSAAFIYNSDNQRAKMTVTQNGNTILTRWYIGSSDIKEIVGGVTTEYNFIGGDAYTAPVVAVIQSGSVTYYYLLRDYLGNITHVYNASTSTAQEYSFDAWGRRRNPVTWSYDLTGQPELFADRGFTSHEYLKYFNLYNMNGRLYDPLVGRFLNVDPYVQMPDYTQNFNRYSYCINNPLKFTDPDGEWFLFDDLVEFVVGGAVNVMFNLGQIDNFWEGLAYFGSGGVGTWISIQSFGLAAPVGAAITSAGNSMLETNFLTKENGYSFKSIDKEEWKKIGLKTGIGAISGWAGDKIGGKLADKVQDKFHITSEFWTEATSKMIENGITDGLGNYLNSTIIDHSGWVSKEAFKNLGMGIGEGIAKGMTSTLLNQKWARPELQKFKELGLVLDIQKNSWKKSNLKFLYNPLLPPSYRIPSPPKLYIPNSNN